jgi:acyl-CoA synthetase (AMP-forming)/AMP-acid ligase II
MTRGFADGCSTTRIGGIATCDPHLPIDSSSVGHLYAGTVAKVVSTEDGRTLPPSTPGEIQVKGPVAPVGYYNDVAATRDLLTDDGWLRTGDLGLIREDGRVFIIDRLKVGCCCRIFSLESSSFPAYMRQLLKVSTGPDQSKRQPCVCNRARGSHHDESRCQRSRRHWSCCVS